MLPLFELSQTSLFNLSSQISPIMTIALLCLVAATFVKERGVGLFIKRFFIQTSFFFICSSISYFIFLSFPGTMVGSAAELLGLIFFGVGMIFVVFTAYKVWNWI